MRGAWLVGVVTMLLWAAPAQAAVVSVDAAGVMDVQVPEGGDLLVECHKPPSGGNYCDVLFASSIGGQVTGVAPACLPQTIGGRVRCTGVVSRNVTMGSGDDRLTLSASASVGYGGLFGGVVDMGAGDDTVSLGESYGSDVIVEGAGTDAVRYGSKRFTALDVTAGGGGPDGSPGEADDISAEVLEGGRGADVLTDLTGAMTILGGDGGDTITGGSGPNVLDGQFGDDRIDGLGGDDVIIGGPDELPDFIADDDVLTGGAGADTMRGGDGADELLADDETADQVDCGAQSDSARADLVDALLNCEIEDFGIPVGLSIADVAVDEAAGDAVLTIVADAAPMREVAVRVRARSGTAVAGADFADHDEVVAIPAGASSAAVRIPIMGDDVDEDSETFAVALSDPVEAVVTDGEATVTIADDDTAILSIADAGVTEGGELLLRVAQSVPASRAVSVRVRTADGQARAGSDYTAIDATLTIPAGEREATVAIPTGDDMANERDETFTATLSEPVGALIGRAKATLTILDDDAKPRPRPRSG